MRPIVVVALLALPALASAQKPKRRCNTSAPDSVMLKSGPVYRDCDVDEVATRNGNEPRIQMDVSSKPPGADGCLYATFEFVVDTAGTVELGTVHEMPGNNRDLEDATRPTLKELRYTPARLDGRAVRQLVSYKRSLGFMTRVVVSSTGPGGSAGPPPSGSVRPPRC